MGSIVPPDLQRHNRPTAPKVFVLSDVSP